MNCRASGRGDGPARHERRVVGDGGIRQYGDVTVVERYRLVDEGRGLEADVTIAAPDTFVAPWSRSFTWELDAEGMIFESICDPEDRRF